MRQPKSRGPDRAVSIAEMARRLINLKPQVRAGLAADTLNQSAVAREFIKELGLAKADFHATLSAIKRAAREIETPSFEPDAKKVIAKSTISLRTDVAVVRFFPNAPLERLRRGIPAIHSVQGASATSLIVDGRELGDFAEKNREHVLETLQDLTEITIISPQELTTTPGVLLLLLFPLYNNGINVEEVLSSHTDTILLVSARDANRAFALLDQLIRDARRYP